MLKLVDCFEWDAENAPGTLAKASAALAKQGVNLDALWACESDGESKIAAIGKKADKLAAALKKLGARAERSKCFYASGTDKAGACLPYFRALADAGINIECANALAAGGSFAATFWVGDADLGKAKKALKVK